MMQGTVSARLDAEVEARRLEPDPAQREAARRLDDLADALRMRRPGGILRLRLRLRLRSRALAPRGLYLWGGVGRGKTLLMDLF